MFEAPGWVSTSFDPTLVFPGEGPTFSPVSQWRFNSTPDILHSASLQTQEREEEHQGNNQQCQ